MGLPIIFIVLPWMVLLFFPVVIIEYLAARTLKNTPSGRKWRGIFFANLASTFLGWPIAWLVLVAVQVGHLFLAEHFEYTSWLGHSVWPENPFLAILIQAAWLPPYQGVEWMALIAAMILFVPFFFMSVWIERWIHIKSWEQESATEIRRFCWRAHGYSYAFLYAVVLIYLYSIVR